MQASSYPKPPFLLTDTGRLAIGVAVGSMVAFYVTVAIQFPPKWTFALILGLLSPFLAFLSGDVKRFFVGLLVLTVPFVMFQKMLSYADFPGPHICIGIGLSILDFVLLILLVWWVVNLMLYPEERENISLSSGLHLALLLYIFVSFLCVFPAPDRKLSSFEMFKLLRSLLIFLWIAHNIRSPHEHRYLVFFIVLGGTIQSVITFGQSIHVIPFHIPYLTIEQPPVEMFFHGKLYFRPGGTLTHSNVLSLFVGMSIPLAFSVMLQPLVNRWFRFYCWFAYISGLVAHIVCFSRGGWVNIFLSTSVILVLHYRKGGESKKQAVQVVTLLSIAMIAALITYRTAIIDRLFYSDPALLTDRWATFRDALKMWKDHPILGIGLNNYVDALPLYLEEGIPFPVHNVYLLHLADTGIVGLAAFLVLIITFLRKAFQLTSARDSFRSGVAIALAGIMLGVMGDELFSFAWKWEVLFYLFCIQSGWLVALDRCREEEEGADDSNGRESPDGRRSPDISGSA